MDTEFSFAGHSIQFFNEKDGEEVFSTAYCPICGRSEISEAHGRGERNAQIVSFGKITTHMRMAHGLSDQA